MNKYSPKDKLTIINRYVNGESISSISRSSSISRTTIYTWLNKRNETQLKEKAPNFRHLHYLEQTAQRQKQIIEILQRAQCAPTAPLHQRYEAIKQLSKDYKVHILCEALQVAKGSYYNHLLRNKNGATTAAKRHSEMQPIIEQIFHENNQIFGASKIYAILKDRGYAIAEKTVARIMHEKGLFSIRGYAKTLYKQHKERKTNILQQQFNVPAPNKVWVSDVTYFSVFKRMYYICVILDLYARKVIAYKVSKNNSTQLTKGTFKVAYKNRHPDTDLMFHSDQGANYTSNQFRKYLKSLNVKQSFSRPGTPYDNSVMESFFGSFKREGLYRYRFKVEREFFEAIDEYINFYNEHRPHSILMNQTPNGFESRYYSKHKEKSENDTEHI